MPAIRLTEDEFAKISGKPVGKPQPSKGVITARERGRQTRLNAKRSSEFRVKERAARSEIHQRETEHRNAVRISTSRQLIEQREVIRQRNAQQQQQLRASQQKSQRVRGAALAPVDSLATANAASPPSVGGSGGSLAIKVVITMAVLILMYLLVTKSGPTGGFLSSLGNWIATLSTTTPLFHSNAPTSTASTSSGPSQSSASGTPTVSVPQTTVS